MCARVINGVNRKSVDERHDIKNDIFGVVEANLHII